VAAKSSQANAIRLLLLKEHGIDKASLHAAGYWKRGKAGHRDEQV
jgi:NADPH-dependent ferric siderophore reductase